MRKSSLKKYLVFGLLIVFGAAGILVGCGQKEDSWENGESVEQDFSMEQDVSMEELQWTESLNFGWQYFPQEESLQEDSTGSEIADGGTVGCFKEKTGDLQEGDTIEVFHDVLSEEALFALINSQAKELTDKYPERKVVCRVNGSTEIEQFVQLDAETAHRLYLRMNDSVYILHAEMERGKWQEFLEEWLFMSALKWDEKMVLNGRGSVVDTYAYTGYMQEGLWRLFQYEGKCMRISEDILLFHKQDDGFYFKLESGNEEERHVEEMVLRSADIDLQHDSFDEAVSYFSERYPDMNRLEAYLYGEDTLWDADTETDEPIFYRVDEPETSHGFFCQNGKTFEVCSQGKQGYYNMVDTMRSNADYDYNACFVWERGEDGSMVYEDNLEGKFSYVKDLGNEKTVRVQAEIMEIEDGELVDDVTYSVKIVDEKENKILQELQEISTYSYKSPFSFEDFNADGYLDLTVEYFYGANGGSASHYIFSPSKGKFVKLDSELEYYGMYGVDSETRRLYMHYHGSAISGTEITYQWKNEMDYEKIKQFDHDSVDDDVQVTIIRYENGQEEILSDYLYSLEEYGERLFDIWGTYNEDFIWEKEVADKITGEKYIIRYAEVFLPEEAEKNGGSYYDGRIYVYNEDTYLLGVTHSEIVSQSESIEWENGSKDKEQAVVVHYADGGYSEYSLSGLITPDYEE